MAARLWSASLRRRLLGSAAWLLVLGSLLLALTADGAGGTWTPLTTPPPSGLQYGLLMSDGTVICANGGTGWYRLTPDIHGSYINGTWSQIASMNYSRLFFSSDVLTNGNVYVAGGEYGGGPAELYNTLANTWTVIQPASANFSDAASKMLPSGNVLQSDSQSGYVIYNAGLNVMQGGGSCEDMNETCWVRLPSDNILAVTGYSTTSEHYVPSLNAWNADNNVPVPVFGYGGELGPAFVLPNGNVFQIGATTNTAIYTPGSTLTSAGTWVAGPPMVFGTNQLGAVDAPAAMMNNGNILLCIGPVGGFNGPCSFYEYNYVTNSFTQVGAPGGGSTYGGAPFGTAMLDLPDGTVLFFGGQGTTSLFVYAPSGSLLAAGQPSISSLTENADGSYHLTGTGLNGVTGGAAYGDDWQMDTSYPQVRLTNSMSGSVYYARTYGWSSTTIQNPNPVTTEFTLPQGLPAGTYSLVAAANGIASAPQSLNYAPPAVPAGLTALSGSNALVKLSWSTSAGATAYNLKQSTNASGYFVTLATLTGAAYTNAGLFNGFTYYYKVDAIGPNGPSSDSAAVSATPAGPPPAPTGLTAVSGENSVVPLAWNSSSGATSYNLKRSANNGGPYNTVVNVTGTTYNDVAVTNGITYYYIVTAVGPNGESAGAAQVSATPLTPVVVTWFKADAITGLGNGAAVANWTDSSGNGYTASQSTANQRPTYATSAINGLPVVHFNSANSQSLTCNRPVQDNFTIFCVFRSTQGLNSGTLYYQGAGLVNAEVAGVTNDFGTCLFANGQVSAGTGNPDVAVNSLPNYNDGKPHLLSFRRTEQYGEVDLFLDGAYAGSVTGSTNSLTSPSKVALGSQQTGGDFLTGDLGEVKIYATALSDADRKTQESGLMSKWGVTNHLSLAGNLLVSLDATALPTGALAYLTNNGAAGGVFQSYTNSGPGPQVVALGGGTHGVLFDGNCMLVHNLAVNGAAQYAPANLTASSFTGFSVEAWVYEPTIINDNPVVSWGTRGSCGGQISCAYGNSAAYGGLAVWCYDHAWGTLPAVSQWHYLVWTMTTNGVENLYADGTNNAAYTSVSPDVDPNNNIAIAYSHGSTAGSLSGGANGGCEIVGRVRIMDGLLTSQQVANNYVAEAPRFNLGIPAFLSGAPLHRWSFTNAATGNATGLVVTDTGTAQGTTNRVNGIIRNNGGTAAFTGSQLTLSGGSSATAPYVDFTNALISVLSTNKGGSGQLTVEAWLTPQGAGAWARLFECGSTTSGKVTGPGGTFTGVNYAGLVLTPNGDQNQSAADFAAANDFFDSAVTGNAMHLALTWDDVTNTGLLTLYENGVQAASATASSRLAAITDVNNWLGRSSYSADANLQGSVAEFRIFNRLLTPAELLNDYLLGPAFAGTTIKWNGNLGGNWDVNTTSNWLAGVLPVKFENGVSVLFDDTLAGTTNVTLASVVQPSVVTVSNVLASYVFGGPGGLGGSASLNKLGAGTLSLNVTNTSAGTLVVGGGTLAGTGAWSGPVSVTSGGGLAPGSTFPGVFAISNTLALAPGSRTLMRFSLDGGMTNNDRLAGLNGVTYGGNLIVTNQGATPLSGGEQFHLFANAGAGFGGFNSITVLPSGNYAVFNVSSGILTIALSTPPTLSAPGISGGSLVLTGAGGTPGASYSVLTATNLALPFSLWLTNTTGLFDGGGNFSNGLPILPAQAGQFFRIKSP